MSKKNKTVIILGSSNSQGNTFKISKIIAEIGGFDLIDLNNYEISYFDYEHKNRDDDFLPLMRNVIGNYQTIIFATPVYWYTMSAVMKTFFDRISDLLKIEKDLGRKLRGKNMGMVSCSDEDDRVKGFNVPFIESAGYLGMNWIGDVHCWLTHEKTSIEVNEKIKKFISGL